MSPSCGTHQKHFGDALLMSTQNICFCGEKYSPDTPLIWSYVYWIPWTNHSDQCGFLEPVLYITGKKNVSKVNLLYCSACADQNMVKSTVAACYIPKPGHCDSYMDLRPT